MKVIAYSNPQDQKDGVEMQHCLCIRQKDGSACICNAMTGRSVAPIWKTHIHVSLYCVEELAIVAGSRDTSDITEIESIHFSSERECNEISCESEMIVDVSKDSLPDSGSGCLAGGDEG
ncbi:MAG: hypothetical protein M1290_03115 [Candidatus Thermoplasmatota archaeon]|jgi:hypothetical protein|nr:hypothetical protein [Candidatus Thermoplasmatota archaeon]